MTSKDARKLINKAVTWEEAHDPHRGTCLLFTDRVTEVKGRNICMQERGWVWLPNLVNLKETP